MWPESLLIAVRATMVTLILTGLLYPFAMTGFAQLHLPGTGQWELITAEQAARSSAQS